MSSSLQRRVIKQRAVKLSSSSSSSSSVQKTVEKKSSIWKDYNKEF
jgi:flagellar biosynthesis/type III secretory pathway chaperone